METTCMYAENLHPKLHLRRPAHRLLRGRRRPCRALAHERRRLPVRTPCTTCWPERRRMRPPSCRRHARRAAGPRSRRRLRPRARGARRAPARARRRGRRPLPAPPPAATASACAPPPDRRRLLAVRAIGIDFAAAAALFSATLAILAARRARSASPASADLLAPRLRRALRVVGGIMLLPALLGRRRGDLRRFRRHRGRLQRGVREGEIVRWGLLLLEQLW